MLHGDVDTETQRLARPGQQRRIEILFDAGDPAVVDIGVTKHVRRQVSLRIDAPNLIAEIQTGNTKAIDRIVFARRRVSPERDESALLLQFGVHGARVEIGHHGD